MYKSRYLRLSIVTLPFAYSSAAQAISLDFVRPNFVEIGKTITADLVISDLGNNTPPSLGTYDLDVTYDDSILDFDSATFGDSLIGNQLDIGGFGSITEIIESSTIRVNVSELSLDFPDELNNLQSDRFTLASLTFNAIGKGTSPLEFENVILGDAIGDPLFATTNNSNVTVKPPDDTTVPESSSIVSLIALGLLGIKMTTNRHRLSSN